MTVGSWNVETLRQGSCAAERAESQSGISPQRAGVKCLRATAEIQMVDCAVDEPRGKPIQMDYQMKRIKTVRAVNDETSESPQIAATKPASEIR